MNVLVTGANGFIGKALCDKLIADAYQVRGAVRGVAQMSVLSLGVEGVQVGDIGPETDWSEALAGIGGIVHLAARVHVMRENTPDSLGAFREVNVEGTKRLAQQAAEAGVKRLVYISSVKVNGEGGSVPYTEMDRPAPQDPYAVSKWEAEQVLRDVVADAGLGVVVLRLPLVYGPGVRANFLRLLKMIKMGFPLPLGGLHNHRSMVYIGNMVDAIVTCLEHPKAAGETFLVSDGEDVSTPDLIRMIAVEMGKKPCLLPFPPAFLNVIGKVTGKSAEVKRLTGSLCLDIGKTRRILDWKPPFTLEEGIRETVFWYKGEMRKANGGK